MLSCCNNEAYQPLVGNQVEGLCWFCCWFCCQWQVDRMSFGRQPGLINNCENTHLLIQVEKQYRCLHPLLHKSLLEREVDTHTHTYTPPSSVLRKPHRWNFGHSPVQVPPGKDRRAVFEGLRPMLTLCSLLHRCLDADMSPIGLLDITRFVASIDPPYHLRACNKVN